MNTEKKLTAWEVLRFKFPATEYVLIEEVSDASGFARSRSIDFMLINLWQSRGLAVTGIERKSHRGDWLKEMKTPAKQENHFKHCDYFYLLTDREGVAKLEEIPETWGWYHINDSGILKTMKQAPKLASEPIGRSLLCAMLRRAADKGNYVHRDSLETEITARAEKIQANKNYQLERKAEAYDALKQKVDDFEKACGISITHNYFLDNSQELGKAVKVIASGSHKDYEKSLQRIEEQVKRIHDGLKKEVEALQGCTEFLAQCPIDLPTVERSVANAAQ